MTEEKSSSSFRTEARKVKAIVRRKRRPEVAEDIASAEVEALEAEVFNGWGKAEAEFVEVAEAAGRVGAECPDGGVGL